MEEEAVGSLLSSPSVHTANFAHVGQAGRRAAPSAGHGEIVCCLNLMCHVCGGPSPATCSMEDEDTVFERGSDKGGLMSR